MTSNSHIKQRFTICDSHEAQRPNKLEQQCDEHHHNGAHKEESDEGSDHCADDQGIPNHCCNIIINHDGMNSISKFEIYVAHLPKFGKLK